ncbi:MAG: RES family NAD+ phosphorylase [Woeseiaceae bacterium]|nr:RES family NAD+ phosphorylase [Woeseiaceae bacterium]
MPGAAKLRRRNLAGSRQYRIIPSRFPPIALFERLVDADELEIAYAIESLTNDRVQAGAGDLYLVDKEDWVTGPGASIVMAAFTHVGRESRFSDGSYGVYYAGLDEATAIAETVFHTERRMRETAEPPIELEMRCYIGTVQLPLDDIRGKAYEHLRDPDLATWPVCQAFGAERRAAESNGLLYVSARRKGGRSIAAFTPRAVSRPRQGRHLKYCWNGERVVRVLDVRRIRQL